MIYGLLGFRARMQLSIVEEREMVEKLGRTFFFKEQAW